MTTAAARTRPLRPADDDVVVPSARRSRIAALAARPELLALLALAAVLNLWSLGANGMANEYYSAAVRAMSESWHAFLFGSFDAAGVMTVDKPPLALWIQALSARLFGFGAWSMLVPQALMGVAAVGLLYDLVRRRFGRAAAFTAGLALALTPVSVAIWRHDNPDALLALCSLAAVWAVVRGLEDDRTRWLVLAGVCVGLGFDAKMAAALLVVPGLAAAWLWVAPRGRLAAVRGLFAGGAAMAVVGLAWPVLVWLTPAADRPWVSGTSDNSIWSLILGYNGLGRLFGQDGGPAGAQVGAFPAEAAASAGAAGRSAGGPACCACSTRAWAARRAGCSASRSSPASASSLSPASGGRTRARAGCSPSAAPSPPSPSPSARRRASSTPTTRRCSPPLRPRSPAPRSAWRCAGGRSRASWCRSPSRAG